jgi:hypothetical protein
VNHQIKRIVDSTLASNAIQMKNEFGIYPHKMENESGHYAYLFGSLSSILNLNECANQFPAGKDYGSLHIRLKINFRP